MSNSPGFRGGLIGSAVPKSFSSSPNSGAPFQRTCQTAREDSFLPSNSIDLSLSRKVANPLGAIFGSVVTHPTAVTTRDRSPSFSTSCWPAVFVIASLCSRKKPDATMRYVAANLGEQSKNTMQIPTIIAAEISAVDVSGKISATIIPAAAIGASPTNGWRGTLSNFIHRFFADRAVAKQDGIALISYATCDPARYVIRLT